MGMDLGKMSISLSVADLDRSRAFYEALGFEVTGGDADEGWLMLVNHGSVIGLFHEMFEGNVITFNPGIGPDMQPGPPAVDVRDVQQALLDAGLELVDEVEPGTTGAGHLTLTDPDGNAVLIDQLE